MAIGQRINMFLISGGNWNNNTNAGVWNANWNNNRSNTNNNTGFRLDYGSPQSAMRIVESQGCVILHNGEILPDRFLVGRCPKTSETFV